MPKSRPPKPPKGPDAPEERGESSRPQLSHIAPTGEARMVDVGGKEPTRRRAVARGEVRIGVAAAKAVRENRVAKGNVIETARLAAIQGAKRTSELIPLCHPLPLDDIQVGLSLRGSVVEIRATASAFARTGVEMEALTAVSVAALTLYDMLKAVEKGIEIGPIVLLEKSGGRSGEWRRPQPR